MIEITNANQSEIISRSKNLRGLLDYRKKDTAEHISIQITNDGGANFEVVFQSGNICKSFFADFNVCRDWFYRHFARYYGMIETGNDYFTCFDTPDGSNHYTQTVKKYLK